MERPTERRSPERQPHTLRLLRRLSGVALAAALLLLLAPRVLDHFGLIGPSAEDRIAEAERAVRAAESYGARPDWPSVAGARQELEAARRLAAQGNHRLARRAARRAMDRATEAQAAALVAGGQAERRVKAVVEDLDGQVNELEDMFEALPAELTRDGRSALQKKMREARKAAATVFLANDEKRFADALAREQEARRALAQTRAALEAAGAPRRPAPGVRPVVAPSPSVTAPAPAAGPTSPAVPYVSEGACPFECCTYRTWTVERATETRVERKKDAPVSFALHPGDKVQALTGAVLVSRLGRARAPRDMTLPGLALRAGDEVSVLHPVGEGFWLVWKDGKTASAQVNERPAAGGRGEPELRLLEKPHFTWWVLVRPPQGRPGWSNQPENFGNKDRCA
jgi:hypothetical protein